MPNRCFKQRVSRSRETIFTTVFADTAGIWLGAAGANQVWDFSSLQTAVTPAAMSVLNAAGTPYAVDFPFANVCGFQMGDPDYYSHYRKEPGALSNIGSAATYSCDPAVQRPGRC